jgi:FkbM family methyltransferase
MSRRVFLDVGANTGQTLSAVLDSPFDFDDIICFEPTVACCKELQRFEDARITIHQFGLWSKTCSKLIFGPGELGGSIWKDIVKSDATELCEFVQASDWFKKNIDEGDTVFLKMNCEGAECDILDDLLDSGEFRKVSFVMVDFDVRKIASQKHREKEIRQRLRKIKFPRVAYCKEVMKGRTHAARIGNWLSLAGAFSTVSSASDEFGINSLIKISARMRRVFFRIKTNLLRTVRHYV